MGAPAVLAGTAVAGLGLSIFGQVSEANSRADAAEADAADKQLQAIEVERRAQVRAKLLRQEGDKVLGAQEAMFGKAGVEMTGSPLLAMEETAAAINEDIYQSNLESMFRASQLRRGANVGYESASDTRRSGWINASGTLLTGASRAYQLWDPNQYSPTAPKSSGSKFRGKG